MTSGSGTDCGDFIRVVLSDKDRFFGAAIAELDVTIRAIPAAIMKSSFIIAP